jgi:hypothetical protein
MAVAGEGTANVPRQLDFVFYYKDAHVGRYFELIGISPG